MNFLCFQSQLCQPLLWQLQCTDTFGGHLYEAGGLSAMHGPKCFIRQINAFHNLAEIKRQLRLAALFIPNSEFPSFSPFILE